MDDMRAVRVVAVAVAMVLLRCASAPVAAVAAKTPHARIALYVNGVLGTRQSAVFGTAQPGRGFIVQPIVIYDDPSGTEGCPEYRVEFVLMGEVQTASENKAECADPRHDSFEARGARVGQGVWVVRAIVKTARREYREQMEVQVW
jgi:hypothetical protein